MSRVSRVSRGGSSLARGRTYEQQISHSLQSFSYAKQPVTCMGNSAGAGHGIDVQFAADGVRCGLEIKNSGGFEAGGRVVKVHNGRLVLDPLFRALVGDYVPFKSKIPSFMRGNKDFKTWLEEKADFKDEVLTITDTTVVSKYYQDKGCDYIQIEGCGLYHTGMDVLALGVPLFTCATRVRIRCKRHGSTSMPSSVQASILYDKKSIVPSPYDLLTRIPPSFKAE